MLGRKGEIKNEREREKKEIEIKREREKQTDMLTHRHK